MQMLLELFREFQPYKPHLISHEIRSPYPHFFKQIPSTANGMYMIRIFLAASTINIRLKILLPREALQP
jgi:hypothetical protein